MAITAQVHTDGEPVVVVVLDRAHARFFEVTGAGARELSCLHSPAMRGGKYHSDRQGGPGWGEHAFHDRIREEERRHYRAIAVELDRLQGGRPPMAVVLAGPGSTGVALRRALPPLLAERVIGTAKLNPTEVTPAAVQAVTATLRREHERDEERALVAAMLEGLGTGRAENGLRAVLRALAKGQVRVLLVRADTRAAGFRCGTSGRLVPTAADCRGEGQPVPVGDVMAEAIADARREGAAVSVIRDADAAQPIEGLAALLRFA